MYKTIRQFLEVFPELKSAPLYVAGESYGGKYVPALAIEIHNHRSDPGVNINLEVRLLFVIVLKEASPLMFLYLDTFYIILLHLNIIFMGNFDSSGNIDSGTLELVAINFPYNTILLTIFHLICLF